MIRVSTVAAAALCLAAGASSLPARADVSIGVRNGDRVIGTLSPADAEETLRVDVPKGAKIIITVAGKKLRGAGPAPAMNFDVFGPTEGLIDTGTPRRKSARLVITSAPSSGEYRVVFYGDGENTGNYAARVKWRTPRVVPIQADLTEGEPTVDVDLDADQGARLNLLVKAARGSAALPRFSTLNGAGLTQPSNANAKLHRLRRQPASGLPFGNSTIVVTNAGAPGSVTGKVIVVAPRPSRRKIAITAAKIGPGSGGEAATGEVIDAAGGIVAVEGGELDGAGVDVPPGALGAPTAIFVATSPDIEPPGAGELDGVGPTVLMGPEGLQFADEVTVVMPFDLAPFAGDYSTLRIFTRNARGRVTEITSFDEDDVNEIDGTISFTIVHFSSFRVFGPPSDPVPSDLNGDGVSDLVMPAPSANGGLGKVYVKFAPLFEGPLEPGSIFGAATSEVTVSGAVAGAKLGDALLVADVNGDDVADLLTSDGVGNGNVCIFFGGPGFSPTGPADADVILSSGLNDAEFGVALAVGDVNGDGVPDVLVGAEGGKDDAGAETGTAHLFLGPVTSNRSSDGSDRRFIGEVANDLFGCCVAIGDVTGDGSNNVIVGADMIDRPLATGRVYVWDPVFVSRDNGAGGADIILSGESEGDGFGLPVTVGKLDDDDIADLVVGQGTDSPSPGLSSVYVFYGSDQLSSGDADTADARIVGDQTGDLFGAVIQIQDARAAETGSNLFVSAPMFDDASLVDSGAVYVFPGIGLTDGNPADNALVTVRGEADFDMFGVLVPGAPYPFAVFAPGDDVGGTDAGRVYVFTSELSALSRPFTATFSFVGAASGEYLGAESD